MEHKQKDLDSIKSLSWREFEELTAEAYRRKGYSVVENYGVGADGGIDYHGRLRMRMSHGQKKRKYNG